MSVLQMLLPYQDEWIKRYEPQKRLLTGRAYQFAKRAMDISLVVGSLPVWLPVIGILALIILLTSPGAPVIFTQLRTGKGGRRFCMYKFRTMVPNAE